MQLHVSLRSLLLWLLENHQMTNVSDSKCFLRICSCLERQGQSLYMNHPRWCSVCVLSYSGAIDLMMTHAGGRN